MSPLFHTIFILLALKVILITCEGPNLVSHSYSLEKRFLFNKEIEFAQFELEFDQPLHLEEPLLCGGAEKACQDLTCTPCDWSSMEAIAKVRGLSDKFFSLSF